MWDIQDSSIRSHGRKTVDVTMIGKRSETHNQVKMDVSDVGKDVLSMGRLLRSGPRGAARGGGVVGGGVEVRDEHRHDEVHHEQRAKEHQRDEVPVQCENWKTHVTCAKTPKEVSNAVNKSHASKYLHKTNH